MKHNPQEIRDIWIKIKKGAGRAKIKENGNVKKVHLHGEEVHVQRWDRDIGRMAGVYWTAGAADAWRGGHFARTKEHVLARRWHRV